jgi:hypothetical protein
MKKTGLFLLLFLPTLNLWAQNCPTAITVSSPATEVLTGKIFQLSVAVNGLPATTTITYNWAISSGSIISGQGTAIILVDPGTDAGYCTATVEIGGLRPECKSVASETVEIKQAPQKIITLKIITTADINNAVKKFIAQTDLKNLTISQTALININTISIQQFLKIKAMIEKSFTANGILSYQYTINNAGISKGTTVEMFLTKQAQ